LKLKVSATRIAPVSNDLCSRITPLHHQIIDQAGDLNVRQVASEGRPVHVRMKLMDRMRRRVLQENPDLPADAQEALFAATMLFERIVWLARRNALLILPGPQPAKSSD
jgi:hypothetical protein